MKAKANYVGKRFGLLKVIDCVEASTGTNKGGQWLCMCKCRRTVTLGGYQLHSRNSCGCLGRKAAVERGKSLQKSDEEKLQGKLYRDYKRKYKEQGYIPKEDWILKTSLSCQICGEQENQRVVEKEGDDWTVLCDACKDMKRTPLKIFLSHLSKIYKYQCK